MTRKQISLQNFQPQLKVRQDNRGRLIEICQGKFSQCNLLKMKKGSTWGKHYHKKTTEFFYVLTGEISVLLQTVRSVSFKKNRVQKRTYQSGDYFTIAPYTFHTIRVNKSTTCIVLYSHRFNARNPDLYYIL